MESAQPKLDSPPYANISAGEQVAGSAVRAEMIAAKSDISHQFAVDAEHIERAGVIAIVIGQRIDKGGVPEGQESAPTTEIDQG